MLQELLEKAKEALRRDLTHLFLEVSTKKLTPSSARDLVAYTKLLQELTAFEKEGSRDKSPEALRTTIKALIERESDPAVRTAYEGILKALQA